MAIAEKDPGIVRIASRYGVPETVDRLERLLKERVWSCSPASTSAGTPPVPA